MNGRVAKRLRRMVYGDDSTKSKPLKITGVKQLVNVKKYPNLGKGKKYFVPLAVAPDKRRVYRGLKKAYSITRSGGELC